MDSLLGPTGLSTVACAGPGTTAETHGRDRRSGTPGPQIADPQQRDQLLKTLQALILVAKQGRPSVPLQERPDLFTEHSQGLFFAFGELTERLATSGRVVVRGLLTIPIMLMELPTRLRDPATLWSVTAIVVPMVILVILGLGLQLFTNRLEAKLRARTSVRELRPWWWKAWLSLLFVGLAVAPYIALLGLSGIVFSIFPGGAIPAGIAALVIATLLLHRFLRTVARVLFDPDTPSARLLSLDDSTADLELGCATHRSGRGLFFHYTCFADDWRRRGILSSRAGNTDYRHSHSPIGHDHTSGADAAYCLRPLPQRVIGAASGPASGQRCGRSGRSSPSLMSGARPFWPYSVSTKR